MKNLAIFALAALSLAACASKTKVIEKPVAVTVKEELFNCPKIPNAPIDADLYIRWSGEHLFPAYAECYRSQRAVKQEQRKIAEDITTVEQ